MSIRLVQLRRGADRVLAKVDGDRLFPIRGYDSIYGAATAALAAGIRLLDLVNTKVAEEWLDYEPIYEGRSDWLLLPSVDHPDSEHRMLVSGTGLTHLASVQRRDAMHANVQQETDSARMYRWGVEGGNPAPMRVGTAPEWFYKGNGSIVRAHGEPLPIPEFAEDGGEEPELAGVYLIDSAGLPVRIGMTVGNEFSDHRFERRNYLYLAHSKLRFCAIGPELIVDPDFKEVPGEVRIIRGEQVLWNSAISTGESVMCHSLANIEHHHFKYPQHRTPGDIHVHFFGADAFSFGSGVELQNGDLMEIQFNGFGRPLRNVVERTSRVETPVKVRAV